MSSRTMRYMLRPHNMTSPDFMRYYRETVDMIRKFMHTKADLVPVVGPGRTPMDMCINSFCEPGDRVLFIENGYWGRYPAEIIAPHYEVKPVLLSLDVRRPMSLDLIEKSLKKERNLKAIHLVHVETEAGAINPVRQIGELIQKLHPNALFLVDSASAFPGNPLRTDDWGIDIDYFVSHKGFNGPSGLNFVSVNEKAWKVFEKRKTKTRSWYTSVGTWWDAWVSNPNDSRHCLASFPNVILHAMRAKLDLMEHMGEKAYLKKYEIAARTIREGIRAMTTPAGKLVIRGPGCDGCPGCTAPDPNLTKTYSEGRYCSQTMLGVAYPMGMNWKVFQNVLENRFWHVVPSGGFGDSRKDGYFYSSNGMRIGFIRDDQHIPRNIISVLASIGLAMREAGARGIEWDKGVEAAAKVMKEYKDIGFTLYKWPHDF